MDKLLIVDTDEANLKKIVEGLEKLKYFNVLTAVASKPAVNILNDQSISVLISGLQLPDFDGIELLAYMSRSFPTTPCIAMLDPGQSRPWFIQQESPDNILEFIEKPIDLEDLISLITNGIRLKNKGITENGITLKNFLPLIEIAKKSCQMDVRNKDKNKGRFYFLRGKLIDTNCANNVGDAAISEMIEWDNIKISISRLPSNKKEAPIGIALMEKLGVSFDKRPPITPTPAPLSMPEESPTDPAITANLDKSLKKYSEVLKSIKGYMGLAILSSNGNLLAADLADAPIDFSYFSTEFTAILNQCLIISDQKDFKKCNGFAVSTEKAIIIMIPSGDYRFIGLISPDGNGFFMQIQLEKIIPQILRQ